LADWVQLGTALLFIMLSINHCSFL
jgi:hypothetical protein